MTRSGREPTNLGSRARRFLLVMLAVAGVSHVLAAEGSMAAAPDWVNEPSGVGSGDFYGVTCIASSACWAVGQATTASGGALLDVWSGRHWTPQTLPAPPRSSHLMPAEVSCVSQSFCIAVGSYDVKDGTAPLAERWDGRRWTTTHVPIPSSDGPEGWLSAISCVSARACLAVGQLDSQFPLAERWNGRSWSRQALPPSGDQGELLGVSCPTAAVCLAVGDSFTGDCQAPLLERWTNHGSKPQSASALPCGGNDTELISVSCASSNSCMAVGQTEGLDDFAVPLAAHWDGVRWTRGHLPDISHSLDPWGGGGTLQGVSCASRVACTAVGDVTSGILDRPLAERWNGNHWRVQTSPRLPRQGALADVACPQPTRCFAVGSIFPDVAAEDGGKDQPMIQQWRH
jgi:hypothetical protein